MNEDSKALYARIARRLLKLVEEHGAPNNFGLDELDIPETPLVLANTIRGWNTAIGELLAAKGYAFQYTPRLKGQPANIHVRGVLDARSSTNAPSTTTVLNPSKCCGAALHFETMSGVLLLFREENGQKVYSCRCSKCNHTYETTQAPRSA